MFPCHQAMWLISPGVVLHKKLQDFSVGHAFLLEALESPFMVGGKVGFNDLVVAVLVCSMSFAKARKYLMRPLSKIQRDAKIWGLWCRIRGIDPKAEMTAFSTYVSAYTESPDPWKKQGEKGRESCLPVSVRLAWCLMSSMSEDEAWNCPMARALSYFTAYCEYNGQDFMTEKQARNLGIDDNG